MGGGASACAVLVSGGVDSAVLLSFLKSDNRELSALFVDYGQPASQRELVASRKIAEDAGIPYRHVRIVGLDVPPEGEIPGRNSLLVSVAASRFPGADIAIGIHAGTGYLDCSEGQVEIWQRSLDHQYGGTARLIAPFVRMDKSEVVALGVSLRVSFESTYSCEVGRKDPCMKCRSCLDRREINVLP